MQKKMMMACIRTVRQGIRLRRGFGVGLLRVFAGLDSAFVIKIRS